MREFISVCLLLIDLGVLSSSNAATITSAKQTIESKTALECISYGDWPTVLTEQGISLPARVYLVPLRNGEQSCDLTCQTEDSIVTLVDAADTASSLLTAESPHYDLNRLRATSLSGSEPVVALNEVVIDGTRFLRVMIFPVTVSDNQEISHRSLTLSIGTRAIATSELIREDSVRAVATSSIAAHTSEVSQRYVIITNRQLESALAPLVKYKSETGYQTTIKLIDDIESTYAGRDSAEKLRNYLIDFQATGGKYVLLAGDETILPVRYAYHYTNRSDTAISLDEQQICDLYFADLTGDWDRDHDNTWGERIDDSPDMTSELIVGRLPFSTAEEFAAYTTNLIRYESSPGDGDPSYLGRTFFYSSDQMRDLNEGQHNRIAQAFPPSLALDTVYGVEAARGDDPAPTNLDPDGLKPVLREGYGIINILAHGRVDGFVLKSSNYNEWPKSLMLTCPAGSGHGSFADMTALHKPAFYYSLACDNASFDSDQPPFSNSAANLCQTLLSLPDGAVGFVGYTRWGWVGTSFVLQEAFFDSLFAHPEKAAAEALNAVKVAFNYYRDMVYGLNYYGDPTLKIYDRVPSQLSFTSESANGQILVDVRANGQPVSECHVMASQNGSIIAESFTDQSGEALLSLPADSLQMYRLSLVKDGFTIGRGFLSGSIATDVNDNNASVPTEFALLQNYPNPFNPGTTISFDLPVRSQMTLQIYNILGQEVRALISQEMNAGRHAIIWNGLDNSGNRAGSGMYFYRLVAGDFRQTKKMLLIE